MCYNKVTEVVALLAEGVDRNKNVFWKTLNRIKSPSSRRAWIEIAYSSLSCLYCSVALLAEGVDRNEQDSSYYLLCSRRPPCGGRG